MNDMHDSLDDERLRRLLDEAANLPREVEPPAGAWQSIRGRIDAQRVVPIGPNTGTRARRSNARWWRLAAAGVVVVGVSVAVVSERRAKAAESASTDVAASAPAVPIPAPTDSLPGRSAQPPVSAAPVSLTKSNPALAAALDQYQQASHELEEAVTDRATTLSPQTREVVRRSLATIDGAITDLRAALGSDPRNAALGSYLSAAYEQKLDFLKRVRAIPGAGM